MATTRRSRPSMLVALVDSASGGDRHEVKTDGERLWCDCWPWRTSRDVPKRCRHTDEVLPMVQSLGGVTVVHRMLQSGIVIEDAHAAQTASVRRRVRPAGSLADEIERLLESLAEQQAMPDTSWRRQWLELRARVVAVSALPGASRVGAAPVETSTDWLGGGRAIILRS